MNLPQSHHRFVFALGAASFIAAMLVAASQISAKASDEHTGATSAPQVVTRPQGDSLFAGIPQRGAALGTPRAPVTLVEYADLQCPYCADWARETLPVLVKRFVRTGKLRIVFRGLTFVGPDSHKALGAAIVAGRQNHFWDVVHALYEQQGTENTGWVTNGLVSEVATGIPDLDGKALLDKASTPSVDREIERIAAAADAAGVSGTPSFELGRSGSPLEPFHPGSLGPEGTAPAIEAVLNE